MAPWQMYLVLTGQTTIEYYFYKAMAAVGNTTVNVVCILKMLFHIVYCFYLFKYYLESISHFSFFSNPKKKNNNSTVG